VELRQLIYFDAVVRCGGFTRASEQLHIAQPAISAQIRHLETELGAPLLSRTTRRITLTHAGELFLARARRVLTELDAARGDLADLAAVLRGRVTIGTTEVLGAFDLPAALASFASRYPHVALTLRSGLVAQLLSALDVADVDLVLGPVHTDLATDYLAVPLAEDRLVLLTAPEHRLAGHQRVMLAELRDELFICLPSASGLRRALDAAAADAGFEAQVPFEAASPSSVRDLVSAGLGIALLPATAAHSYGAPVDVHEVQMLLNHPPFGVIHRRELALTPASQVLRDHLIKVAGTVR